MLPDVDAAGARFVRTAGEMTDDEWRGPSALPGWTRAHVVAHVALNGEAFVAVADALRCGRDAVMYPGDAEARDRAIGALAAAPRFEVLDRLEVANDAFVRAWDPAPPAGVCATAVGHPAFEAASVPLRRLRELQVHLVDLACEGATHEVWSGGFVDADLAVQWATVAHRTDRGVRVVDEWGTVWAAGPEPAGGPVQTGRRQLLAWVLDRAGVDGLPALEPWSNRSRWEHLDRP